MAQSRHLEEFATRICAPDKAGNPGKIDKASCMGDLDRLASRVLPSVILIVFLAPNLLYFIVDLQIGLKRQKQIDESDDPERCLLALVLAFTLTPVLTLTLTDISFLPLPQYPTHRYPPSDSSVPKLYSFIYYHLHLIYILYYLVLDLPGKLSVHAAPRQCTGEQGFFICCATRGVHRQRVSSTRGQ
jgi:hypothetical protein